MEITERNTKEDLDKNEHEAREPHERGLGSKEMAAELGQMVDRLRDWVNENDIFGDATGAREPNEESRAAAAFFGIDIDSTYRTVSELNQRVASSPGDHLRSKMLSTVLKIPGLPKEGKWLQRLLPAAKTAWEVGIFVGERFVNQVEYQRKVEGRKVEADLENLDRIMNRPQEAAARVRAAEFGGIDVAPDPDREDLSHPLLRSYPDIKRRPL